MTLPVRLDSSNFQPLNQNQTRAVFDLLYRIMILPERPDRIKIIDGQTYCISGNKFPEYGIGAHVVYTIDIVMPDEPLILLDGTSYQGDLNLITIKAVRVLPAHAPDRP